MQSVPSFTLLKYQRQSRDASSVAKIVINDNSAIRLPVRMLMWRCSNFISSYVPAMNVSGLRAASSSGTGYDASRASERLVFANR